jgi:hypothetical protein
MNGPPIAPPVGLIVYRLHRWGRIEQTTELFRTYASALACLATAARESWADITFREDVPEDPAELTDAETVLAFYGGDGGAGGPETPTFGESFDTGFEIVEDLVGGPEPAEVTLRLASLRVLDTDPDDPDVPAVTYCLDAEGLTIAVASDPGGHPRVLITPEGELSGVPITVRLEDPFRPGGFERTYRVS